MSKPNGCYRQVGLGKLGNTNKRQRRRQQRPSNYNLELLVDGWLELESDPGTFSLLIEDFGCHGAQVEEVYDLDQKFEGPVYGFIFLFKWLDNHHQSERSIRNQQKFNQQPQQLDNVATPATTTTSSTQPPKEGQQSAASKNNNGQASNRKPELTSACQAERQSDASQDPNSWSYVVDEKIISDIFFAKQMISNSCATHALISVLLNCDRKELNLGPVLSRLKDHTKVMNPENKGYAIGNLPELAKAHNSHASYSSLYCRDRPQQRGVSFVIRGNQRTNLQQLQNQPETYHFVSYVPINNHLYELDGLKNYPIDHGPIDHKEGWTEKFRRVIKRRLLENKSSEDALNDIRYNLMAVVPDKRVQLKAHAKGLERHLKFTKDSLKQLRVMTRNYTTNERTHRTTTTMVDQQNETSFRPSSPVSNGTLTASETGSVCNSPKHLGDGDAIASSESEIPNPPYSPLSNATLSASETGSVAGDPEDCFPFNEKDKIDRFFFVKIDPKQETPEKKATTQTDSSLANNSNAVLKQKLAAQDDLKSLSKHLQRDIIKDESLLKEELDKRRKYKIDNARKTHNYEPFIMTFLSLLAKQGNLAGLIENDLGLTTDQGMTTPKQRQTQKPPTSTVPARQQNKRGPKVKETPTSTDLETRRMTTPKMVRISANNASSARLTTTSKTPETSTSTPTVRCMAPPKLVRKPSTVTEEIEPVVVEKPIEPNEEHGSPPILTTPSGRPQRMRRVNYKYISTGRPRGRPKKSPD